MYVCIIYTVSMSYDGMYIDDIDDVVKVGVRLMKALSPMLWTAVVRHTLFRVWSSIVQIGSNNKTAY